MSKDDEAQERALRFEELVDAALDRLVLPEPWRVSSDLRQYLERQAARLRGRNYIAGLFKATNSGEATFIRLGPTIDKGPTDTHFNFDSGARLSFSITVRRQGNRSSLVSYRFDLHLRPNPLLAFLRFELRPERHADPLHEPKCHLHPGVPDLRLPFPVLAPLELLDRIFFVIEPKFAR